MIIKKVILIFLFSTLLFFSASCNQSQKESVLEEEPKSVINKKEDIKNFFLSNKLYLLAPEFNSKDCESFGECDCCSSNYLFLDDENFICVDYCLEVDNFYTGKYKIENERVELKYNSTVVNKEYNWESESDTTNIQPEYFYKIEKCKPFQSTWIKFNCKEKICFKTTEKETDYASVDKTKTYESFLEELKKEGILKRLNVK
ncbi:hypothetical protein [Flavobacterium sp. HJJ]|uniref:hypothetical protein n=1 Tax=Flavobacterium sp. HJJ TaxID=2783792 RepID=UPI00188BEE46|nr:hypothetical protein [Flavobacterium sp. HJJ]MBF4470129.1 hypothetical protein [Flavobacterium sp. HJJ]